MSDMLDQSQKLHIFSGASHIDFSEKISAYIGEELRPATVEKFNDGEVHFFIDESVRGKDVFIIQTMSHPINESIMELLLMIDCFSRASARSITAVIPYYAYNRQDHKEHIRDPIAAKVIANLIVTAGADRIITMDLHSGQLEGFFDIPVDHIKAEQILAKYIFDKIQQHTFDLDDIVVVSPDMGGVNRARRMATRLNNCPLVILDRRRPKPDVAVVVDIVGEVKNKIAFLVDDTIDTAGSMLEGAKALYEAGAKSVFACATHGVFSGNALEQLYNSNIEKIIVTDTLPLNTDKYKDKVRVVSVAPVFGEVIIRLFKERTINKLFD